MKRGSGLLKVFLYLFFIMAFAGCGGRRVERLESDFEIDLSGRWSATDSRMVAEALVEQVLDEGWYRDFKRSRLRNPSVIVGRMRNRTYEHINVYTFIKDIERYMLNSGEIDLVASADERERIREERADMQRWASVETAQEFGREQGADFVLTGVLNSIIDEEGGERVVYYQVDLNLVDIESNRIVWTGQKKIKKYIRRPLFTF